MKHLKYISIFILALSTIGYCEEGNVTHISQVDGIRYDCLVTAETIRRTGAPVSQRTGPNLSAVTENLGTITLIEAIKRGDEVAREILGESYTSPKPIWVMRSAERLEHGDSGGNGGYYRISYDVRRSLRDKSGGQGNLQIIVLLNGEVLRPVKKS